MDNTVITREYFDVNFKRLRHIKRLKQPALLETTKASLASLLEGMVLDIGSGGQSEYFPERVSRVVSVDLSLRSMLDAESSPRQVVCTVADGRELPFHDNTFDAVAILHTVHHLAAGSLTDTRMNIRQCLKESCRVLKEKGSIVIVDAFCAPRIQFAQNALFPFSRSVCNLVFRKPMVYYFSSAEFASLLLESGFKEVRSTVLDTGNVMFCPWEGSFGLPFKYLFLSHILMQAGKHSGENEAR